MSCYVVIAVGGVVYYGIGGVGAGVGVVYIAAGVTDIQHYHAMQQQHRQRHE